MSGLGEKLRSIAAEYCEENSLAIDGLLGDGNDGAVFSTDKKTAVKVLERQDSYDREKAAYLRLAEREVHTISGFRIPRLVNHDDTRNVVEMTIVFPPSVFDFVKSYVDRPPDFSAEALEDWLNDTKELFDRNEWPIVQSILGRLRAIGIHYFDARPWNIRFLKDD